MRTMYVCIMLLFLTVSVKAQSSQKGYKFQANQVDNFIKEVYGDQAQKVIFSNKNLYGSFKKLILERMEIVPKSKMKGKEVPRITEQGIFDTYNNNLSQDTFFDIKNFNPLKYKLVFFNANSYQVYEIDNTGYLLIIRPQSKLQN